VTAKTYRSLTRYVAAIAEDFGLGDWEICVLDESPDSATALASCEAVFGRRMANLRFSHAFFHSPPEDQRNTVVHELLHAHLAATDQAVEDHVGLLGSEARVIARNTYNTAREYAVDALAAAIADKYPLWEG
jgi:hypothetical protein